MSQNAVPFHPIPLLEIFSFFKYDISQLKVVILEIGMDQINTKILQSPKSLLLMKKYQIRKNENISNSGMDALKGGVIFSLFMSDFTIIIFFILKFLLLLYSNIFPTFFKIFSDVIMKRIIYLIFKKY